MVVRRQNDIREYRGYSPYVAQRLRYLNARGWLAEASSEGIRQVSFSTMFGMKEIFNFAAQNMSGEVGEMMTAFAAAVKHRADRKVGMLPLHQNIGKQAQRAIVDAYNEIERPRVSYRLEERYAGGKLRKALASTSFFDAQPDGLLFINKSMLDRQAAQWYRLNFGAGTVGHFGRQPREYPFVWPGGAGQKGGSMGLRSFPVSGNFNMPLGLFTRGFASGASITQKIEELRQVHAGAARNKNTPEAFRSTLSKGKHALLNRGFDTLFVRRGQRDESATFFPYNSRSLGLSRTELARLRPVVRPFLQAAIPTLGIHAEGFFDAGMQSLAEQIPLNYAALMRQWLDDSLRESRGPAYKAGITGERAERYKAAFGTKLPAAYRDAYKRRLKRGLI